MTRPRVLFAASEVYPFAKSGGLADVTYALPRALARYAEMSVVMPLYRFIDKERHAIVPTGEIFEITLGSESHRVELFTCLRDGVNHLFVESPLLCDRAYMYGPPDKGYADNALRFGLFAHALVEMLKKGAFDAVHLNDWQCGLVPLLIDQDATLSTPSLFTIHNLAYQGTFNKSCLKTLGIRKRYYTMDAIEFYGQISFMKAGIAYANAVTTVSPHYAEEVLTEAFGCGLEGFLALHRRKLHGIVNGVDAEHFSPRTDAALEHPYADVGGKAPNKRDYLQSVGLEGSGLPLFVFIGRFTWQKGIDLLIKTLPALAKKPCNIAILGEGETPYRERLRAIAQTHANVHLHIGYDEALAHRIYAAADFLMMPSLFEPCGLNQMIAMQYGAIPVVHHVGGLVDTVRSVEGFDPAEKKGYGIAFSSPTGRAFSMALTKALKLYNDKPRYDAIAAHDMAQAFSWDESARTYLKLYETLKGAR